MDLNYSHLQYFHSVALEGSVVKAAESLGLTPQTISGQIKLLESVIGKPLFIRVGRGLALTDTGHIVKGYADQIFLIGDELQNSLANDDRSVRQVFSLGIVKSLNFLIAHKIISSMKVGDDTKLVCIEGDLETLISAMATNSLDMVISDQPIPIGNTVKADCNHLGSSQVALFSHKNIAEMYSSEFPASLGCAPFVVPSKPSDVRLQLRNWLQANRLNPRFAIETNDAAFLHRFGSIGENVFPASAVAAEDTEYFKNVRCVGVTDGVKENYYIISNRRISNKHRIQDIYESVSSWLDE